MRVTRIFTSQSVGTSRDPLTDKRERFSRSSIAFDLYVDSLNDRAGRWGFVGGSTLERKEMESAECNIDSTGWARLGKATIDLERAESGKLPKQPFDDFFLHLPKDEYTLFWDRLPAYLIATDAGRLHLSIECHPFGKSHCGIEPFRPFQPEDKVLGLLFLHVHFDIE